MRRLNGRKTDDEGNRWQSFPIDKDDEEIDCDDGDDDRSDYESVEESYDEAEGELSNSASPSYKFRRMKRSWGKHSYDESWEGALL
mmetsp:Transcript_37989/g.68407  ORF Transcript_37989/g.68407 Transcript_37989/m.68407 type:complete len:86 (-) Transcript_37989:342-599(-)|eukprot:CAMPEP_0201890362 /NCGR_PEP_ID=MMETSP0902-20130614/32058_1 /ASSEMBLY_ACC=CAM_ASM_000551 /TAXON_ID=420261 /ORGANISM="Thalassiosira antarctica, Strain CCMP982" /LENGTH=85 /DNA_ID=CAMNT_0048421209 /DNA_START=152 /DNA_END=409 /DNA_ORIENTATION=+